MLNSSIYPGSERSELNATSQPSHSSSAEDCSPAQRKRLEDPDIRFLLDNTTVLDTERWIDTVLGDLAPSLDEFQARGADKHVLDACFAGSGDKEMHQPLANFFNVLASADESTTSSQTQPALQCLVISKKNEHNNLPDLFLTFDAGIARHNPHSFRRLPGITIEALPDCHADLNVSVDTPYSTKSPRCQVMQRFMQRYGLVGLQQWAKLPHRFLFTITISGDLLRIWAMTTTGALVTEAIRYRKDASVIWRFLQVMRGGRHCLGWEVGPGMLFRSIYIEKNTEWLRTAIAEAYMMAVALSYPSIPEWMRGWLQQASTGDLLVFEKPNCSYDGQDAQRRENTYLVLSCPLYTGTGVFSRATKCYLALPLHLATSTRVVINDLCILKTSWQHVSRGSELEYFKLAIERNEGQPIKHLAIPIAGGYISSSLQVDACFICAQDDEIYAVPYFPSETDHIEDSPILRDCYGANKNIRGGKELRWILFQEVGAGLNNFGSTRELLQVFYDTIEAYGTLLGKCGIMHRDISDSNILINLSTRRGLLIDLDLAVDVKGRIERHPHQMFNEFPGLDISESPNVMQDPLRSKLIGTKMFMSIGLQFWPFHQEWHDLESFFWLLVCIVVRHLNGFVIKHMEDVEEIELGDAISRKTALKILFPDNSDEYSGLTRLAKAKGTFLKGGRLVSDKNASVTFVISQLRIIFSSIHQTLSDAMIWLNNAQELKLSLGMGGDLPSVADLFSLKDMQGAHAYLNYFEKAVRFLLGRCGPIPPSTCFCAYQDLYKQSSTFRTAFNSMETIPTYLDLLDIFRDALRRSDLDNGFLSLPAFDYCPPPSIKAESRLYSGGTSEISTIVPRAAASVGRCSTPDRSPSATMRQYETSLQIIVAAKRKRSAPYGEGLEDATNDSDYTREGRVYSKLLKRRKFHRDEQDTSRSFSSEIGSRAHEFRAGGASEMARSQCSS